MIQQGQVRWLRANPIEGWPREQCTVLSDQPVNGTWIVEVKSSDACDDGLREVSEDQFESNYN